MSDGLVPTTSEVVIADVTSQVVCVDTMSDSVRRDWCGAVVTFVGVVRDHDGGRGVARLRYEAHPDAGEIMAATARDCVPTSEGVRLAVRHRVGDLRVGEVALAVAVASAHRRLAFDAASRLVDSIKLRVPIWKRQVLVDGTTEWVGPQHVPATPD